MAAKLQDLFGVDLTGFVHLEGLVDESFELYGAVFGPLCEAFVDELFCGLNAFVEYHDFADGSHDPVAAAVGCEGDVSFLAADLYSVVAGGEADEICDFAVCEGAELGEGVAEVEGCCNQAVNQIIAEEVNGLDRAEGDESATGVLFVAFGDWGGIGRCHFD